MLVCEFYEMRVRKGMVIYVVVVVRYGEGLLWELWKIEGGFVELVYCELDCGWRCWVFEEEGIFGVLIFDEYYEFYVSFLVYCKK